MVIKGKTYAQLMALLCLTSIACSLNAQHVVHASRNDKYVAPESKVVQDKLEWFRDQKLCLMMHFGLYSIWGITESWPLSTRDAFWARSDIEWVRDDAEFKRQYYALNRCFNPVRFNAKEIAKFCKGDIYAWGEENARKALYTRECVKGTEITRQMANENIKHAEDQIARAGYRLAAVLNDIFK